MNGVTVVIPTLNEEAVLPRLLRSLEAQVYTGEVQVLVVDGGSSDKTVPEARKFQSRLNIAVIETEQGLPHQRNKGASRAIYEHLLFIDADSKLPPSFLSRLSKKNSAKSNKPYIALPLIIPDRLNIIDYVFAFIAYAFFYLARFSNPVITGMCIVTTKSNHKAVGGFDKKAVYADDIQYGIESFRKGARYHIFLSTYMFSSARRGRDIGRVKLGKIWMSWYRNIIKNGSITDKSDYGYKFGHFK